MAHRSARVAAQIASLLIYFTEDTIAKEWQKYLSKLPPAGYKVMVSTLNTTLKCSDAIAVFTNPTFNKCEFNIDKKRKRQIERWHTFVVIYKGRVLGVFDTNYDYTRNYSKKRNRAVKDLWIGGTGIVGALDYQEQSRLVLQNKL
ncbi:hypothetical protein RUND412_002391 [Rhizina undulata]